MEIRSAANLPKRVSISNTEKSRTKQSFLKECDINTLMAKFLKTGAIQHARLHAGEYGFASSVDFHTAMNIVTKAKAMFDDLPSDLRNRFEGDPARFLDFVQDPANRAELDVLGLTEVPAAPPAEPSPEGPEGPSSPAEPGVPAAPAEPPAQ